MYTLTLMITLTLTITSLSLALPGITLEKEPGQSLESISGKNPVLVFCAGRETREAGHTSTRCTPPAPDPVVTCHRQQLFVIPLILCSLVLRSPSRYLERLPGRDINANSVARNNMQLTAQTEIQRDRLKHRCSKESER